MENNGFENSFKDAFHGAEVAPSESVWTNIELTLEKKSDGRLKRNLLMFQWLAAASVVFACGMGALYFTNNSFNGVQKSPGPLTGKRASEEQNEKLHNVPQARAAEMPDGRDVQPGAAGTRPDNPSQHLLIANSKMAAAPVTDESSVRSREVGSLKRTGLSEWANRGVAELRLPEREQQSEPDAVMVMMARLKDEEKKYQQDEKPDETLWASVGFGAGSYKPNRQTLNSQAPVTGESFSAGLNVAGKLSKRIILQGGISYITQNADFTSTASQAGTAMLTEFTPKYLYSDLNGSASPYVVNSAMQYVSVPLQAGYLIVDRAFGVQLNAGVATDLFIRNTLTAPGRDYQSTTQAAGKNSPYRTVNFSGLIGTELSYRIADQYRLSLNPGLRYSLHSIYKENVTATITPVTYDVSLRFRYIFR